MLSEHTLDQLRALRLDGMVRAIEDQASSTAAQELPFDDRLTMLHYRAWCSASAMREVSMPQFWKRLRHQVKGLEEARARVGGTQRRMCNINLGGAMPARVLETSSGEAMRVS